MKHILVLLNSLLRCGKRHQHIFFADCVEPDIAGVASSWVIGECLIDNIPRETTIAEVCHERRDVILEDLGKRLLRPWCRWVSDPIWQLVVPDQVVASNDLAGRFRKVKEIVASSEVVDTSFRLGIDELRPIELASSTLHHGRRLRWITFMALAGVASPKSLALLNALR